MIQVAIPGFAEPSRIYSLKQDRSGELQLAGPTVIRDATIDMLAEALTKEQTVLVDSGHPYVIESLRQRGYHVVGGRI